MESISENNIGKLRIIHEMCQGLEISMIDFFNSPLFAETNLEP